MLVRRLVISSPWVILWTGSDMKKTGAKDSWTELCCRKKGGLGVKNVCVE